jgi:hypothetical protein
MTEALLEHGDRVAGTVRNGTLPALNLHLAFAL